jgi:hypothetical protein
MKLGILYTTWTGDDMQILKDSIEQHLPFVDGVLVFMDGASMSMEQIPFSEKHRIDYHLSNSKIQQFNFLENDQKFGGNPKAIERNKHNQMIQEAKKQGFTHFILAAGDHFYSKETFEAGKEVAESVDVSFTKMVTYYRTADLAVWPLEDYYMPFIHKMYPETEISTSAKYTVIVDPSVKVNTCSSIVIFEAKQAVLHHYSMVRKNILRKFRNAASSIRWTKEQKETFINEYNNAQIGGKISYFQGRELKKASEVLELIKQKHYI